MKRIHLSLMIALLASAALVAGCGGATDEASSGSQTPAASQTAGFDVSSLLTQDEAADFLGTAVGPAKITLPEIAPAQPYLLFYEAADGSDRFIQVGVVPDSPELAAIDQTAEKIYLSTRDDIVEGEEMLDGIGQEAFWGTLGLHVLQGPYYVTIGVGNTNDPANLTLAKEVAALVLPRLP